MFGGIVMDAIKRTDGIRPEVLRRAEGAIDAHPGEQSAPVDSFVKKGKPAAPGLIPKPKSTDKSSWTIFKFSIVDDGLRQDVAEGVSPASQGDNVRVVAAEMSESGRVAKEFQAEGTTTTGLVSTSQGDLGRFLKEGMKKYPARHYMVVFDGHSTQFRPHVPNIAQAIKDTGTRFDIVKFSSCTMAETDVANQFKDAAKYYIASEGFSITHPYLEDLKQWGAKNPEKLEAPAEMAARIIQEDAQDTNSVLDLSRFPALSGELKNFGAEILKLGKEDLKEFKQIVNRAQHFAMQSPFDKSPLVDIPDLAAKLKDSGEFAARHPGLVKTSGDLADVAQKQVIKAAYYVPGGLGEFISTKVFPLAFASGCVGAAMGVGLGLLSATVMPLALSMGIMTGYAALRNLSQGFIYENIKQANGLSLFLPVKSNYKESYVYNRELSFWKETGWDKVMEHLAG